MNQSTATHPTHKRRLALLLLVCFLAAAVAGLMIVFSVHTARIRSAIKAVERDGGIVEWEPRDWLPERFQEQPWAWMGRGRRLEVTNPHADVAAVDELIVACGGLGHAEELVLAIPAVDDDFMAKIAPLESVSTLDLNWAGIGDRALETLSDCDELEILVLTNTNVSDRGLASLERLPRLRALWLDGTLVSDRGMQSLARFSKLEEVSLSNTAVTDEGVAVIAERIADVQLTDD